MIYLAHRLGDVATSMPVKQAVIFRPNVNFMG
jgi:hypothetical protein